MGVTNVWQTILQCDVIEAPMMSPLSGEQGLCQKQTKNILN